MPEKRRQNEADVYLNSNSPSGFSKFDDGFIVNSLMAGLAAAFTKSTIAPIDRVKLLLQLQSENPHIPEEHRYKGIIDAFIRIPREQGFLAFWRGNLANILRYAPNQALNFGFFDQYHKKLVKDVDPNKYFLKYCLTTFISGAAAGFSAMTLVFPLELARTRLALDVGKTASEREFHGIINCIVEIYKVGGIRGVYSGYTLSAFEVGTYRMFYFGIFNIVKIQHLKKDSGFLSIYAVAYASTAIAGLITYPIDTVRRRIMMHSGRDLKHRIYKGVSDCTVKIYKTEGIYGFFKGAVANVIRATGSAFILTCYDFMKRWFSTS